MILEVSKLDKYEQMKSQPDTRYGVEFQGKKMHPTMGSFYWYRWGKYTFDIRYVRKHFGKKECKAIDVDLEMHQCTRFQKITSQLISMVGDTPFLTIFKTT